MSRQRLLGSNRKIRKFVRSAKCNDHITVDFQYGVHRSNNSAQSGKLYHLGIKQNLKVKIFLGTSRNAVMTQLWIVLCPYLVLAFLKFQSKLGHSMQKMLQLLQLNLFERRDFMEVFAKQKKIVMWQAVVAHLKL